MACCCLYARNESFDYPSTLSDVFQIYLPTQKRGLKKRACMHRYYDSTSMGTGGASLSRR